MVRPGCQDKLLHWQERRSSEYCTKLQYSRLHCTTLHCTTLHCTTLYWQEWHWEIHSTPNILIYFLNHINFKLFLSVSHLLPDPCRMKRQRLFCINFRSKVNDSVEQTTLHFHAVLGRQRSVVVRLIFMPEAALEISRIFLCIWWDHLLCLCISEAVCLWCYFPLEPKPFPTFTLCKGLHFAWIPNIIFLSYSVL